ncbi:MAG: hypothetical protein J5I47_07745 [Vicingus serpentipes]|nr:hypothetical protein [Vicingus serpentipes]
MNTYLLRTISNTKEGKFLADTWYEFEDYKKLLKKLITINPDEYQCFEAKEISNEVYTDIKELIEEEEKQRRRRVYEELKKEFE